MQRKQPIIRPKARKKISKIDKTKLQLAEELSMWDRRMSEFYHRVEMLKRFDLYKAYLLIVELHGILINRRKVKNELHSIRCERHITIKKEKHRRVAIY